MIFIDVKWALKMASEIGETASCRNFDKINVDQVLQEV